MWEDVCELYVNIISYQVNDLSICGFECLLSSGVGVLEPIPHSYQGMLYILHPLLHHKLRESRGHVGRAPR